MATIAGMLALLDEKRVQAERECDDVLAQNTAWLSETVEKTEQQLLYRTCAAHTLNACTAAAHEQHATGKSMHCVRCRHCMVQVLSLALTT